MLYLIRKPWYSFLFMNVWTGRWVIICIILSRHSSIMMCQTCTFFSFGKLSAMGIFTFPDWRVLIKIVIYRLRNSYARVNWNYFRFLWSPNYFIISKYFHINYFPTVFIFRSNKLESTSLQLQVELFARCAVTNWFESLW